MRRFSTDRFIYKVHYNRPSLLIQHDQLNDKTNPQLSDSSNGGCAGHHLHLLALRRETEIGRRVRSNKLNSRVIISKSSFLRRVESPKPETIAASLESSAASDLRRPFPPRPLPHSAELLLPPLRRRLEKLRRDPDFEPRLAGVAVVVGVGRVDYDLLDEAFPAAAADLGCCCCFSAGLLRVFVAGRIGGFCVGDWDSDDALHLGMVNFEN